MEEESKYLQQAPCPPPTSIRPTCHVLTVPPLHPLGSPYAHMLQAIGTGTELQIEQQICKNIIVENNKTSHELCARIHVPFFFPFFKAFKLRI